MIISKVLSRLRGYWLKFICYQLETRKMGEEEYAFDVVYNLLDNHRNIIYSFGIGENISFSEDMIKNFDAEVWAYDPTPKSITYVKNHPISRSSRFHFYPIGLSNANEEAIFFLPQNDNWVSGSTVIKKDKKKTGICVQMKDLSTLMHINGHNHIDLLKMDIEGSEFQIVKTWYKEHNIPDIDQICVEVHDRFIKWGLIEFILFVNRIKRLGYEIVSASKTQEELTFVKKGLWKR